MNLPPYWSPEVHQGGPVECAPIQKLDRPLCSKLHVHCKYVAGKLQIFIFMLNTLIIHSEKNPDGNRCYFLHLLLQFSNEHIKCIMYPVSPYF